MKKRVRLKRGESGARQQGTALSLCSPRPPHAAAVGGLPGTLPGGCCSCLQMPWSWEVRPTAHTAHSCSPLPLQDKFSFCASTCSPTYAYRDWAPSQGQDDRTWYARQIPTKLKFHTELRYRYWTTCTDGQATPHPFSWPAVPSLHLWNNRQFQPGLFLTAVLLFSGLSNGQWQVTETSNHATFTGSENLTIMILWEEKKLNLTTKAQTEFLSLCSRAYISLHMELYIWLYFWTQSIWAITLEILSCVLNSRIYNLKDVSTQNHSWHGNHHHTNRRLAPFLKKSFWQNGISD